MGQGDAGAAESVAALAAGAVALMGAAAGTAATAAGVGWGFMVGSLGGWRSALLQMNMMFVIFRLNEIQHHYIMQQKS
jgi:hypothetical protein